MILSPPSNIIQFAVLPDHPLTLRVFKFMANRAGINFIRLFHMLQGEGADPFQTVAE
jgi:hypothetical protein